MSEIPLNFIYPVNDELLRRLVKQVWDRIPAHDQHVLRELVLEVQDVPDSMPGHALGIADSVDPSLPYSGNIALVVENVPNVVRLKRGIESDKACMFTIAHEFAHIVLRHPALTVVVGSLLGFEPEPIYTDDQAADLVEWHEDHADLQAWLWGFKDELLAFHGAYPKARWPRWYLEIETDAPADVTPTGAEQ